MGLTGNKGEWSELYVLLRLLAYGKLYAADKDIKRNTALFFPILKIIRFEKQNDNSMCRIDFVIKDNFNILEAKAIHKMCILCSKDKENLLPSLNKVPHYRLDDQCILVEAVNKYQGILNMMKYLNAPVEDIVVFGYGINDLDMLTQAPISIAMGNAKDEVKHAATYVTSCASQDGIKKACQYFEWID